MSLFSNPLKKKFTCPYCYAEHEVGQCGLKCSFNIPGQNISCKNGVSKDPNGWIPQASKSKCWKCQDARKRFYCNTLQKEIPSGLLSGSSLPIALIGAKASGKSNYIAVLIHEIRQKMTYAFNASLDICCSEESKRYYDEYYHDPLYKHKRVVEATDAGVIPPLIFPLRFMDKNSKIKNVATLTFYDTAGENLDSSDDMDIFNQYIPNSKGIIILLDPLQVPNIRKQLEGKMALPEINTDVNTILSRVIQNIRAVKNVKGNINIPIALAFTKMDALEQFDIVPPGNPIREESEHLARGAFVKSDFENTHDVMKDILDNLLDNEVLQLLKQFSNYALFGLSALGGVPNGSQITGDEIRPKRVLDPLLWLLAENDYIQKVKK